MEFRVAASKLKRRIEALYTQLLSAYGPQGWWPLSSKAGERGFDARGYHPNAYGQPRTAMGRFEIVMGAILTQNSAWTNAETALGRLRDAGIRLPADVRSCPRGRLARLIRSSGYYNQKVRKLKEVATLFLTERTLAPGSAPSREELLSCWGIGPETADSILLYAFRLPFFVVDAYTRRLLSRVGIIEGTGRRGTPRIQYGYDDIQRIFLEALPPAQRLFNEYHALIVEHAKQHCRAKPLCDGCPVVECRYRDSAHG
jgi:endonuclease-3 related protein